jgi:hypothetical protein
MISMISFNMSAAELWIALACLGLFVAALILAAMLITAKTVREGMKAGYLKYAERATQARVAELEGTLKAERAGKQKMDLSYAEEVKMLIARIHELEAQIRGAQRLSEIARHAVIDVQLALTPGVDVTGGVGK